MNEVTYVEGFHDKSEVVKMSYLPLGNTEMQFGDSGKVYCCLLDTGSSLNVLSHSVAYELKMQGLATHVRTESTRISGTGDTQITGLRISRLSLGGGPLGGIYESIEEDEAVALVQEAIRKGINYIDTAPWYGQGKSEYILGKALKTIPRQAYYIGTKVGRYEKDVDLMFDFSADRVQTSVDKSLKLLGLSHVDILQIHDIEFAESLDQIILETLPAVQKVVQMKQARFIGITGYPLTVLKEVSEKSSVKIDSILTYARNTLIDDELKNNISFFIEKGIGIIDAGVVALGMLTIQGPPPWHPSPIEMRNACRNAAKFCKERNIDIAQLAIQHSKATVGVTTHLLGAGTLEVFRKNWKHFTTELTQEERQLTKIVIEQFFRPLTKKNWEGLEVSEYRRSNQNKKSTSSE